jgi:UDP-galactopyranose mutase
MPKALILGGGFAGTTTAYLLQKEGYEVTLIEKEPHLGGGCRTFLYGGHPFQYGPRVYYGYSQKVFDWVNSFTPIRRFPFELRTFVETEGRFFHYPIHQDDLPQMGKYEQIRKELGERDNSTEPKDFEEYWINRVGRTLYDMFVNNYSKKMWMIEDNKIFDIFKWSAKDKPIESGPKGTYKDSIIGYPYAHDGYNQYFEKMTENVEVAFSEIVVPTHPWPMNYDVVINTTPIDEFCAFEFGELPYVGRDFQVIILPCKQVFPADIRFCHYAGSEPHTRITEFKKLTYHESEDTLLVIETPSHKNKLYPYLTKANMATVGKYLASLPPNVYSIGRLGTYKYSTIEQTICQAFEVVSKITGKPNQMSDQFFGIGDTSMMKARKDA